MTMGNLYFKARKSGQRMENSSTLFQREGFGLDSTYVVSLPATTSSPSDYPEFRKIALRFASTMNHSRPDSARWVQESIVASMSVLLMYSAKRQIVPLPSQPASPTSSNLWPLMAVIINTSHRDDTCPKLTTSEFTTLFTVKKPVGEIVLDEKCQPLDHTYIASERRPASCEIMPGLHS